MDKYAWYRMRRDGNSFEVAFGAFTLQAAFRKAAGHWGVSVNTLACKGISSGPYADVRNIPEEMPRREGA